MNTQDTYQDPVVLNFPDGTIARVYHPILTEKEREKRLARIKEAAVKLLLDKYKKEGNHNARH